MAEVREHGTERGYHQHWRHFETACDLCLAAHANHNSKRESQKREPRPERPRRERRGSYRATWVARFPRLYDWIPGADPVCRRDPEAWSGDDWSLFPIAAKLCAICPHNAECRLAGLMNNEYGVWGGLSLRERQSMGRKARLAEVRRLVEELGVPREHLIPVGGAKRGQNFTAAEIRGGRVA